jgi:long-subunit acyl-CoA synthetase (AMP-forming)
VFLTKAKIVDEYDLSSVRIIRCGAAPLSEEIEALVAKRLGMSSVSQGYGLTETTFAVISAPQSGNKRGFVGVLLPGEQCKVNNHLTTSKRNQD